MSTSPRVRPAEPAGSELSATLFRVLLHGALWLPFVITMLVVVPRAHKVFADFHLQLLALTEVVLAVGDWMSAFYPLLPVVIAPLLLMDGLILYVLRQGADTRRYGHLWSLLMVVLPLVVLAGTWVALGLSLLKLME